MAAQEDLAIDQLEMYGVTFRDSCFMDVLGAGDSLKSRAYRELMPISRGVVVLSTCNRFEIYLDSPARERAEAIISSIIGGQYRRLVGDEAARHLLRVASGLESAIIGEDEILGQVREAWVESRRLGASSELLDMVFHAALDAGAEVRGRTSISKGVLGYPRAAVEIAAERLGGLDGRRVAIVGAGMAAGEMVQQVCSKWSPAQLVVADRMPSKAKDLASACRSGIGVGLADIAGMGPFDAVLIAVKGGLRPELDAVCRSSKLVVDISTPPATARAHVNIEDVKNYVNYNLIMRVSEVPKAEAIVEEALSRLRDRIIRRSVDSAISSIMRVVSIIIDEEAKLTAKNIAGGQDPYQAVLVGLNSTVKKAMFPIFSYLREDPEARSELARELMRRYSSMLDVRRARSP